MIFVAVEITAFVIAIIIGFVALIYKIDRYKGKHSKEKNWQKTGEKFYDKDKLMEVHYDPKTGERSYKETHP